MWNKLIYYRLKIKRCNNYQIDQIKNPPQNSDTGKSNPGSSESGSAHGIKGLNSVEEEEKPLELVHTQSVLIRIENI